MTQRSNQGAAISVVWMLILTSSAPAVAQISPEGHFAPALATTDLSSAEVIDLQGDLSVMSDEAIAALMKSAQPGAAPELSAIMTVARAFISQHGAVLSCPGEEWNEGKVSDGPPTAQFRRLFDGIPLEALYHMTIVFGADLHVKSIRGARPKCPPGRVAGRRYLSQAEISRTIAEAIGPKPYYLPATRRYYAAQVEGSSLGEFERVVVDQPPYVVWRVTGPHLEFRVDASTGQILSKVPRNTGINPSR